MRHEGETVLETDGITGIDWNTGYPLISQKWFGGPYKLIENYVPPVNEEDTTQLKQAEAKEEIVEDDSYVIIDGKKYNKNELRSLLE